MLDINDPVDRTFSGGVDGVSDTEVVDPGSIPGGV